MSKPRIENPEVSELLGAKFIPQGAHEAFENFNSRKSREVTPRQKEVLKMSGQGMSVEKIASELNIDPVTVRNHLKSGKNRDN